VDGIRGGIVSGRIRTGERLPPARELAGGLDVNVHTVLRAYQVLRDEGLLDLRRGRGATVSAAVDYAPVAAAVRAVVDAAREHGISQSQLLSLIREASR
jgi:DNA-binding transcriptional regulator YhcF (GntR family)